MSVVFEPPRAETATADNIVPECPGHFQTHRTMLLAYVNANFVRDKVTLSCIRATSRWTREGRGRGGEGGCYLAISSNIRNRWASIRGTFFLSAFFAASCRSLASDPRSKGRVKPVSAIRFRDDDAIFVKKEIVRGNESMLSDFFFNGGDDWV